MVIVSLVVRASEVRAAERQAPPQPSASQMRVFLDCDNCYADFLQSEIKFVDYVRDRTEADVHVLITRAGTASGGIEFALAFIGRGRFDGVGDTLKTVTENAATDDIIRRQIATSCAPACCVSSRATACRQS